MNHAQKTALLLCLLPANSYAAGYYFSNQDAFATAKGGAVVATADNASAVFYNPAGLTQLEGFESRIGISTISLGNQAFTNGQSDRAQTQWEAAPHIYIAGPITDKISLGFGLNSPFGLGTDWGNDTPFRTVINEAHLAYLSGTTSIAYKINDQLSIGAGFSVNYADLRLGQGIGLVPGDHIRFYGDGYGVSGNIGIHWKPSEKHAFGLTYTTKSTFDLEGETKSNLLPDSSAEIDWMSPAKAAIGYSFRPARGWNIEANIEWLDWDNLNTLDLQTDSLPGGGVGVPFEWESCFIYELGASYTTEGGWVFAAGYDYNTSAQPDDNFNPGVADADRHWFNVGIGRNGKCNDWMLAYQFGYSNRDVRGADNALVNGRYEARHHALVLTWEHRF
ncbi:MAG TPA: outer membrane protein transport protein [Luteolibacter sp.]|nr:outer membrane protein transport protein [Luteolibacter sp.]